MFTRYHDGGRAGDVVGTYTRQRCAEEALWWTLLQVLNLLPPSAVFSGALTLTILTERGRRHRGVLCELCLPPLVGVCGFLGILATEILHFQ